jgi:uncharacterized membrane protein
MGLKIMLFLRNYRQMLNDLINHLSIGQALSLCFFKNQALNSSNYINMNNFLSFEIHGGHDHGGGVADSVGGLLAFIEGLVGKSPHDAFVTVLPGISSMPNIHPLLVHFPIALFTFFVLIEFLAAVFKKADWRVLSGYLLYLGTFSVIFTVIAGFVAADTVPHGHDVHAIMENHEQIGVSILILSVLLSAWQAMAKSIQGTAHVLFLGLAGLLLGLVVLGADLGGVMVYKYGVAVQAVPVPEGGFMHEHGNSE